MQAFGMLRERSQRLEPSTPTEWIFEFPTATGGNDPPLHPITRGYYTRGERKHVFVCASRTIVRWVDSESKCSVKFQPTEVGRRRTSYLLGDGRLYQQEVLHEPNPGGPAGGRNWRSFGVDWPLT